MKNNTIVKVMIASVIMIIVGSVIAVSCFFNGADLGLSQVRIGPFGVVKWDKENTMHRGAQYTFKASSEITTFTIDASVADVRIQRGTTFNIETKNIGKKYISTNESNGAYEFKVDNGRLSSTVFNSDQIIMVTLPESVKVVNADFNIGDIDISGLTLTSLTLGCNTGDVDITNVISETTSVNLDIGDLDFNGDVSRSLSVSVHTGDVDVTLTKFENEYNYDLSVHLGELSMNDQNYGEINAHHQRNNNKPSTIDITLDLGDLDVNFGYDD